MGERETQGLVALMNCGWDQGEGTEVCREACRRDGRSAYVFFHSQDAERLAYPHATLYLGFDALPPTGQDRFAAGEQYDAAAVVVGHQIARTMVDHGLDVRWDMSPGSRIQLVGLDWRRPLPTT